MVGMFAAEFKRQMQIQREKREAIVVDVQKLRERWQWGYKSRFGIEPDALNAMLKATDGKCSICQRLFSTREPVLDHCHATGEIRDMLCIRCNSGLGMFRDDAHSMRRAAEYIEHHHKKHNL